MGPSLNLPAGEESIILDQKGRLVNSRPLVPLQSPCSLLSGGVEEDREYLTDQGLLLRRQTGHPHEEVVEKEEESRCGDLPENRWKKAHCKGAEESPRRKGDEEREEDLQVVEGERDETEDGAHLNDPDRVHHPVGENDGEGGAYETVPGDEPEVQKDVQNDRTDRVHQIDCRPFYENEEFRDP